MCLAQAARERKVGSAESALRFQDSAEAEVRRPPFDALATPTEDPPFLLIGSLEANDHAKWTHFNLKPKVI